MKKKGSLIFVLFLVISILFSIVVFGSLVEKELENDARAVTEGDTIKDTPTQTSATNVKSFQTKEFLTSNAGDVFYDKNTKEFSVKNADMLVLKDLDAEQLKDAKLRNRALYVSNAGAVHIKNPFPIDLDEIGPSTFYFEGNNLRAMEITFPKEKTYNLNNPLNHDSSDFFDIEHMLDSDKDGIIDEVEKLRNLNPFSKDTDGDGIEDSIELLKALTSPTEKVSDLLNGVKTKFSSDRDILGFISNNLDKFSGEIGNAIKSLGLKDNLLRDSDGDGISDILEKTQYNTDPFKYDTDGDGYGDGYEIQHGLKLDKKDPLRSDLLDFNTCKDCKVTFSGKAGDKFFLELKDYKGNEIGSKLNIKLTGAQFSILEGDVKTEEIYKQHVLRPLKTIGDLILSKESKGYEISSNGNEDRITIYKYDEVIRGDHITNVDLEEGFTYAVIQDGDYVMNIKLNEPKKDEYMLPLGLNTAQSFMIKSNNFVLMKSDKYKKEDFYKTNKKALFFDLNNNLILMKGKFSYFRKNVDVMPSMITKDNEQYGFFRVKNENFNKIFESYTESLITEIALDNGLFAGINITSKYAENIPKFYSAYFQNLEIYENKTGRFGEKISDIKPSFIKSLMSNKLGIFKFQELYSNNDLKLTFKNLNGSVEVYNSDLDLTNYKSKFTSCNNIDKKLNIPLFSLTLFFIPFLFKRAFLRKKPSGKKGQASYFIIIALIIIILISIVSFYKFSLLKDYFSNLFNKEIALDEKTKAKVDYIKNCYDAIFDCSLYTLGLMENKPTNKESESFSENYVKNNLNECLQKGNLNPENEADVQVDFSDKASNLKSEHVFVFKDEETVKKVSNFAIRNNIRYAYLNNVLNKVKDIINFDLLSNDLNTEIYLSPELRYYIKDKGRFNKFNENLVIVN